MSKIKVAYIVHGLGAEGISSFTCNLISHLDMNRFDVVIIMAVDDNGVPQKREFEVEKYGVKILRTCDLGSIKRISSHLRLLENILRSEGNFDVVHSNMDKLNGLNLYVADKVGVPIRISHAHCSDRVYKGNVIKDILADLYQKYMLRLIKKYGTDFIGCSDFANDYMHYGDGKIIINGISIKDFYQRDIDKKQYFSEIGVLLQQKVLGVIARMSPPKNPDFIIEVVNELKKIRDDFVLIWAGAEDNAILADITKKIAEYNIEKNVKFLGARSDIPDLLQIVDVFCMPSVFEGLPISAVEAQAAGCKCVISDRVTRLVDAGNCTFLPIESGDAAIWARTISKLFDEQRSDLSFEKLRKFDVQTMADEIEKVYAKNQ